MVRIRTLTLFLLLTALLVPEGAAAEPATRIIVKREPGLTAAERADLRADAGVRLVETLSLPRTEVVTAPAGEAGAALRDLRADTDVVYAQIDHVRRSFAADPYMPYMWALQNTGQQLFGNEPGSKGYPDADSDVVEAWSQLDAPPALAGAGQTVAVVDSGIDATHLDLDGRVDYAVDFVGDRPDGSDGNGHGTHVAGTIVANRENGKGGAGVAPGAMIAAMRALNDEGQGRDSDIAAAFVQAGTEGIPIVNASLGGPEPAPLLADAIQSYPGTLFVVAAGNDGTDNDTTPQYPCNIALQNVLCVGASTNRDARASFSNYGDHSVDLFAPGESILSTIPPGVIPPPFPQTATYAYFDGTSMASPHVAAAAALVLQAKPTLTTVELKDLLMHTADDRPAFAS
jgi:subtilisin family serine protease